MIKKSFFTLLILLSIFSIFAVGAIAMNGNGEPAPTPPPSFCGDGNVHVSEECDDGSLNGQPNQCNAQCTGITASICGNNVQEAGEECDDGNKADGDGCSSTCQDQSIAPTCSVDSMENEDSNKEFFFENSIYINEEGDFIIHGNSFDSDSDVEEVQYTRKSPGINTKFPGSTAEAEDPPFGDSNNEPWASSPHEPDFVNGEHQICCRATDGIVGEASCQEFCIDTQAPNKPSTPQSQIERDLNEESCTPDPNYMNSERDELSFTWNIVEPNGCSPIDHYEIQLEIMHIEGNTGSTGGTILTSNTNSIPISNEDLNDGDMVSIRVRAIDKAGNVGEWSDASTQVIIDNTAPEVEITTPASAEPSGPLWYKNDFDVEETDTDENLAFCEYRIINPAGVETLPWTPTSCNMPINIDVSLNCPVDGLNDCKVFKRATDFACNEEETHKQFDLDRVAPVTTKTVGNPKISPFLHWINTLTNGFFVNENTMITLVCNDDINDEDEIETSGCAETKYRIIPPGTNEAGILLIPFVPYTSPFSLGKIDGLYKIEYFSIDKAGNEEAVNMEIDKLDNVPPKTTKTIGQPQFIDDDKKLWVSSSTLFTLACVDEEVGCETSFVSFDEREILPLLLDETGISTFTLQKLVDGEHFVEFWSADKLGNNEVSKSEIDWLDSTPPFLEVFNPNGEEAGNVQACYQSIVAFVEDSGSGIKRVWAELWNADEVMVKKVDMFLQNDGLYEALMDKQLPAGHYMLKVMAEDNVGNVNAFHREEHLDDGVFVEFLSPATCSVNTELGGSCKFTYHVCMRGANSVEFWMDKLGIPGVPPGLLDATISKGEDSANVGLLIDGEPNVVSPLEPSNLELSEKLINGRTTFDLNLHIPADTASQIGAGAHKLEYLIDSFANLPPILPVCGNNVMEAGETCDDGSLNGHPNKCNLTCTGITASICGNDEIEAGEQCDDDNILSGDGCSSTCQIETPSQL